jgi:hypothetical protein
MPKARPGFRSRAAVPRANHEKPYKKGDFHNATSLSREYNSLWPLKCGDGFEFLIRKGF